MKLMICFILFLFPVSLVAQTNPIDELLTKGKAVPETEVEPKLENPKEEQVEPQQKVEIQPEKKAKPYRVHLDPNLYPRVLHWSFQLELGGGLSLDSEIPNWALIRARPGFFYLRDRSMFMLGATVMSGAMLDWGVGGQVEYLLVSSGLSGQLGAETNFNQVQINASLGYGLFGLEYDLLLPDKDANAHHALMFKIRIPIGYLFYAITEPPRN